jgi:polysaccharide export outer membrane protein
MKRKSALALALLLLAGCGGTPPIGTAPTIAPAPQNQLPVPQDTGTDGSYTYRLGALDKITIEVDGFPDLLREVVVDGVGLVSYRLAGAVKAAGLTTTELARAIEQQMRSRHVRDPRVNVNILEAVSNVLTVDGEVERPGLYPVYQDMSLIKAVALAGGESEFARTSVVLVFREVAGQQYVGVYDIKAIRYGNYDDPTLYPNDRVIVSESEARRLLQTVGPFVSLVTTPLIYLINRNP